MIGSLCIYLKNIVISFIEHFHDPILSQVMLDGHDIKNL